MADHTFRYDPPWRPVDEPWDRRIPDPLRPVDYPWGVKRMREWGDLLKRVKKLEEAAGCPPDPDKPDYLALVEKRIEILERRTAKRAKKLSDLPATESPIS